MRKSKIIAGFLTALVLTNLIGWKQSTDLFAKIRDVDPEFVQEGVASWYGPGFQGRKTASGERFNTYEMTAAHKTLPFNTLVKVTNLDNGNSVVVRINDRGPYVRGRIIDLSNAAKNELQMGGTADVRIEIVNPESEQKTESEESLSPATLFEEQFPVTSKIFVESGNTNTDEITDSEINQLFSASKIRIKVLTPDVEDANAKIYEEITGTTNFNYLDITGKVKFLNGYSIKVNEFTDKSKASELVEKLGSKNFTNIFLEEVLNGKNTIYKVFAGNYKTPGESKDDLVRIMDMDYNDNVKIVKIGQ